MRQNLDFATGLDAILAVRHDLFAGLQPIIDDCCCFIQDTDLDDPLLHNVIAANHEGIRSVRTVLYCGQRHDDYIVADRELNTNIDELSRPQDVAGIIEFCLVIDGPCCRVYLIVNDSKHACVEVVLIAIQRRHTAMLPSFSPARSCGSESEGNAKLTKIGWI